MRTGSDEKLGHLIEVVAPGSRLRDAWPLEGGISAAMTAFEIERPGGSAARFVLRRHAEACVAHRRQIVAHELALLKILQDAAVAAPRPCARLPS